jgi:hypothetical protein
MPTKPSESNIKSFVIQAAKDEGRGIDVKEGLTSFSYYETILSNYATATFEVMDSGSSINKDGKLVSIMEGLPIRGGEEIRFDIVDGADNPLKMEMYLSKLRNLDETTTTDRLTVDCVTKECFSNEMTRVVKRYEGKISETVTTILRETLQADFKPENIEETSNQYVFIGNDRKPFYICTWLGTKSIPTENYGKTGGFFFYQTQDGMNFKSVDNLLDQEPKKKYIYNESGTIPPGYDDKVLNYDMNRTVDVQANMMLGAYKNRTIFFDPYQFKYEMKEYDITQQKDVKHAGSPDDFDFVNPDFTETPTRLMSAVLDVGTLPVGADGKAQLSRWASNKSETNDKVMERMVQSVMRYNQLHSVITSITIAADFSLRAGDIISLDLPRVAGDTKEVDDKTSGKYLISSLCHYVTPNRCFTQLGLIRDSYGRKI